MLSSQHLVRSEALVDKTSLVGIGLGLLGGLAGTVLMDIVMMLTFVSVGERADVFFTAVGEKLGGGTMLGVAIHNLIGMAGGFVFSLLVLNIRALELTSIGKGLALGVSAGAITVPLGCIPLALWLGEPILDVIGFSIAPHLVWGTVLGLVVSTGLRRLKKPS